MTTVSTENPQFLAAIQVCTVALRRLADDELDPSLHSRMHALGERKEFLSQAEHEELLVLVAFAHQRTIEKLEARVALDRLRTALPGAFLRFESLRYDHDCLLTCHSAYRNSAWEKDIQ